MMTNFEDKCCKVLGIILFLLIICRWLQLNECCSKTPALPLDYIDEIDTSYFAKNIDNTVIGYNDRYRLTGYTELKKI